MKKQLMIVGIIIMLITVGFSGCNEETIEPSNPMIIYNFQVIPASIEIGGIANLTWNVTRATTVSIDNNIGFVSLNGTQIIQPTKNTTYTLTAKNATDTITATTEIIVEDITPTEDVPEISWIQNDENNTITVDAISESGLNWDNIQITGIATKPTGTIEAGDSIIGCYGTVKASWNGTTLLKTWTFTEDPKDVPEITFVKVEENNYLMVTSVSESGLSWDNIQITGIATKPTGTIEVNDSITKCSGIVIVSWEGTILPPGQWYFAEENATMPNIYFSKISNKITVWNVDSGLDWNDFIIIYDDLTSVLFNAETGTTLVSGDEVADEGTMIMVGDYIYTENAGTLTLWYKPTNSYKEDWRWIFN